MGRIDWDASFSVHHEELDRQHRKLVEHYNNLHESLLNGTIEEATVQREQTLTGLVEYIDYHFKSEEEYLREQKYSDVAQHCQSHRDFSLKIRNLQKDVASGNMVFTSTLIKLLRNWILDHILKEDKAYSLELSAHDP